MGGFFFGFFGSQGFVLGLSAGGLLSRSRITLLLRLLCLFGDSFFCDSLFLCGFGFFCRLLLLHLQNIVVTPAKPVSAKAGSRGIIPQNNSPVGIQ
jgi:hypothetical protein